MWFTNNGCLDPLLSLLPPHTPPKNLKPTRDSPSILPNMDHHALIFVSEFGTTQMSQATLYGLPFNDFVYFPRPVLHLINSPPRLVLILDAGRNPRGGGGAEGGT
jgi:hypothetical protein